MEIKPIETIYNGYRFRSRLEARWAVFFDAAGIEYQYEPEGFEVNFDGKIYRYLPDFYLPQFDKYVEVKPNMEKLLEDGEKLSVMIDWTLSPISRGLIILGQIPYYEINRYELPCFNYLEWNYSVEHRAVSFVLYNNCEWVLWEYCSFGHVDAPYFPEIPQCYSKNLYSFDTPYKTHDVKGKSLIFELSGFTIEDTNRKLISAFTKARQARFEHGECP